MAESQETIQQPKLTARRGMYVVPSLFTSGSIALGYYIIMQSIRGSVMSNASLSSSAFDHAALAIAIAIVTTTTIMFVAVATTTAAAATITLKRMLHSYCLQDLIPRQSRSRIWRRRLAL